MYLHLPFTNAQAANGLPFAKPWILLYSCKGRLGQSDANEPAGRPRRNL
jgi:hypothetical protein